MCEGGDRMRVRTGWILVFMVAALSPVPCLADDLVVYLVVWGGLQPLQILHENCSSRISQFGDAEGRQAFQYRVDLALMIILPLLSERSSD